MGDTTGVGDMLTPAAVVYDARGAALAGSVVRFESGDTAVLRVLGDGRVRAVGAGITVLRARAGRARDSTIVAVTRRPRMLRVVLPDSVVAVGRFPYPRVVVADGLGDSLAPASNVTWSVSGSEVLRLAHPSIGILASAYGSTVDDLVATAGPLSGRVRVRVRPYEPFAGVAGIVGLAQSSRQVCARTDTGQVFCTGNGFLAGLTGFEEVRQTTPPTPARVPAALVDLQANETSSCGRSAAGDVYCWGPAGLGVISATADGRVVLPARVPLADSVGAVAAVSSSFYGRSLCLAAAGGATWCTGSNTYGNIGPGGPSDGTFRRLEGPPPLVRIRLAETHGCGMTEIGKVWCWGPGAADPYHAQASAAPRLVQLPWLARAFAVIHSGACAIDPDGAVWCWGRNYSGDAGQPPGTEVRTPTRVALPGRFVTVEGTNYGACALSDAGELWCWGQLTRSGSGAPFRYLAAESFTSFSMHGYFTDTSVCGLTLGGRVLCGNLPSGWCVQVP